MSGPNTFLPALSKFLLNSALQINFNTIPSKCSCYFLCCIIKQSTSHHQPTSFCNVRLCLQPTFTIRTSGALPGNLHGSKFSLRVKKKVTTDLPSPVFCSLLFTFPVFSLQGLKNNFFSSNFHIRV